MARTKKGSKSSKRTTRTTVKSHAGQFKFRIKHKCGMHFEGSQQYTHGQEFYSYRPWHELMPTKFELVQDMTLAPIEDDEDDE